MYNSYVIIKQPNMDEEVDNLNNATVYLPFKSIY